MTLLELFDPSLIGRRDAVALEFQGDTYTFGDLEGRSNRLAQLFLARGLKPGDRAIIYMGLVPELAIALLACARLGVTHSVVFGGSEERRVGKECVRLCRSRWSPYH